MKTIGLSGLHLLLSYQCNARCDHCFLSAGPDIKNLMSREKIAAYLKDGSALNINHAFIEGGEPFLFPELVHFAVKEASARGFWVGALTNGFWAKTPEKARELLVPLKEAGLQSLSVSTDLYHQAFVPLENALNAAYAAQKSGIETDIMMCRTADTVIDQSKQSMLNNAEDEGIPVYTGGVSCRGRAAENVFKTDQLAWQDCVKCRESLSKPSRVHIGPDGEIHLCQGLLLDMPDGHASLPQVFKDYEPENHPIVNALIAGGPAQLARVAMADGFKPDDHYADPCQLCFEARRFLHKEYPLLLGPSHIYRKN